MKLDISKEAADWYKEELNINGDMYLRFFVRYGGVGGRIPGFSLGISPDSPETIYASTEIDGITYFIEETDAWYFEDSDLQIKMDKSLNEPELKYI